MLIALTQLLFCQLMGEVIARAFDLAIPGPVIGMSLLLVALLYRQSIPEHLETTAEGILSHLSLLFVPAGVGVVAHLTVLGNEWQAIIGSLIGSTVITVLVTGWVLQWLHRGASHESCFWRGLGLSLGESADGLDHHISGLFDGRLDLSKIGKDADFEPRSHCSDRDYHRIDSHRHRLLDLF